MVKLLADDSKSIRNTVALAGLVAVKHAKFFLGVKVGKLPFLGSLMRIHWLCAAPAKRLNIPTIKTILSTQFFGMRAMKDSVDMKLLKCQRLSIKNDRCTFLQMVSLPSFITGRIF
jgi:hypothetical protein